MFDQIYPQIGAMLKEKFDGAHEVKQKRKNGSHIIFKSGFFKYNKHFLMLLDYVTNLSL